LSQSVLLGEEGHVILVAHDGFEGLQRLRSGAVTLIPLDVEMPRLSGPGMAYHLFLEDVGKDCRRARRERELCG
jgi:CheY-like chemotaxis protein